MQAGYPVSVEIDGPQPQSRLTVFFRLFMIIPHQIILYFLQIAAQVIFFIAWFAILFTGRYPAGMLNFTIGYIRWTTRVTAYAYLLTGAYPPFALGTADYPIRVDITGQVDGRNRLTTFWPIRFILAIPHFIVLAIIAIAVFVVLIIAWFVALFTGSVPAGLHNFLAGFMRWYTRVNAYILLVTDQYPPFSMN
jgi:hypothetical protein